MDWILTAGVGAMAGCLFLLLILLLLRFPRKPIRIGSVVWSGLLNRWIRKQFAKQAAGLLHSLQLQNQIRSLLLKQHTRDQVEELVNRYAKNYLTHTLPDKWPMIGLLVGDKIQDKVLTAISEQLESSWEKGIESICAQHLSEEQLQQHILQLAKIDQPAHWTETIWSALKKKMASLFLYALLGGSLFALLFRCLSEMIESF